jgi:hypothetical protein
MTGVTNHVAQIAVPGQAQITIRAARGEVELGQEYDGEWHGIYVQPEHVLTLIRTMLRMIGMDDVYLYRQSPGGLCHDVEWPEGVQPTAGDLVDDAHGLCDERQADEVEDRPAKDRTAAERMRRYRNKKRDADRNTVTDEPELRLVAAE